MLEKMEDWTSAFKESWLSHGCGTTICPSKFNYINMTAQKPSANWTFSNCFLSKSPITKKR
jgi:hypothetical protein